MSKIVIHSNAPLVEVKLIQPDPRNAKIHTSEQIDALAKTIKRNGWTTPIVIDSDHVVVNGHGRLLAAKRLKMKAIPCDMLSEDITEEEKIDIRLSDNAVASQTGNDYDLLLASISELKDTERFDELLAGFSEEDAEFILKSLELDAEAEIDIDDDDTDDDAKPSSKSEKELKQVDDVSIKNIVIRCETDEELENIYEMLTSRGISCKVQVI